MQVIEHKSMKSTTHSMLRVAAMLILVMLTGCTTQAKLATWRAAPYASVQGSTATSARRVAFAPINGPIAAKERLEMAIGQAMPRGNHLAVVYPSQQQSSSFRQVSANINRDQTSNEPYVPSAFRNELTPYDIARNRNADLLVQGHIEQADLGSDVTTNRPMSNPNNPGAMIAAFAKSQLPSEDQRMVVTWEAYDVNSGAFTHAATVSLSRSQAEAKYPDLASIQDPVERLMVGISRETWSQFAPSVSKEDVTLQNPHWSFGSKQVRQGNGLAEDGLWQMAETQWQSAVSHHPRNKSAWHNLALASVAQEDFEMARLRLSKAKSWIPNKQTKATELWIDAQQKAYHRSFGLPDRPEGWLNVDPPSVTTDAASTITPVSPKDIDEMPWYTSIPFMKPPGWTWKAWLSQPLP
jgi:hypothetical protein